MKARRVQSEAVTEPDSLIDWLEMAERCFDRAKWSAERGRQDWVRFWVKEAQECLRDAYITTALSHEVSAYILDRLADYFERHGVEVPAKDAPEWLQDRRRNGRRRPYAPKPLPATGGRATVKRTPKTTAAVKWPKRTPR